MTNLYPKPKIKNILYIGTFPFIFDEGDGTLRDFYMFNRSSNSAIIVVNEEEELIINRDWNCFYPEICKFIDYYSRCKFIYQQTLYVNRDRLENNIIKKNSLFYHSDFSNNGELIEVTICNQLMLTYQIYSYLNIDIIDQGRSFLQYLNIFDIDLSKNQELNV